MHLVIAGSVATDHLMTFPGRFSDSLIPDQLDKVALSFLVDDLQIRRGGVAANICFGLGSLGRSAMLVAAVGRDFDDMGYRSWLTDAGVDCSKVKVSETRHTARFSVTTDEVHAQIASFYPGAMSEASEIDVAELHAERPIDLLVVAPDDPAAMVRHTATARELSIPFVADPSQQLAFADGETIRTLIEGATYLFSNDYEAALIQQKTGWSADEVSSKVGTRVVTHGENGVVVHPADGDPIQVKAISGVNAVDPTGVGDAFRSGYIYGLAAGLDIERCAQLGCTLAAGVVETTGTQEYQVDLEVFGARLGAAYGEDAKQEILAVLNIVW